MSSTTPRLRILFVDDQDSIRELMKNELPRLGHDVAVCADGRSAMELLDKASFDVAFLDLRMPDVSGWDVFDHLKKVSPDTDVVIATGHGDLEEAIKAIRRGAYDFQTKPFGPATIAAILKRVADKRTIVHQKVALETRLKSVEGGTNIVGTTPVMLRVQKLIEKIAPTDSNVLILGETGTGKELVARRIHELSPRANMPFVAVNCGALPENLVESELFGHRKGAFTGADSPRKGLIEVANGGTLFLDELGELDKQMQVKLLRFLESGELRRVGESQAFHVDVRVICATNRDLQTMVSENKFREDLFFRVNTFEIHLPPLRERRGDIPDLARALAARILKRPTCPDDLLSPEILALLQDYDWHGNVRELANALEHAIILSDGGPLRPEHLPKQILRKGRAEPAAPAGGGPHFSTAGAKTLREIEMDVIFHVLDKHGGDKPKAAAELGIALKTLYNKLNQHQNPAAAG